MKKIILISILLLMNLAIAEDEYKNQDNQKKSFFGNDLCLHANLGGSSTVTSISLAYSITNLMYIEVGTGFPNGYQYGVNFLYQVIQRKVV
ncbi:MAG: hypothetical protein JXR48_17655 [Candidatus Delongbacteria bacterium]|nr:hypothetical protein [Candidatus Delongbacteria bacterium]MBN2836784.1 hypothetical protein [Candidatus Delongbacteria bacterium]